VVKAEGLVWAEEAGHQNARTGLDEKKKGGSRVHLGSVKLVHYYGEKRYGIREEGASESSLAEGGHRVKRGGVSFGAGGAWALQGAYQAP